MRKYLESKKAWTKLDEEDMQAELVIEVQTAVDNYSNTAVDKPEAMFDYLYAELPERTLAQRELAIARGAK